MELAFQLTKEHTNRNISLGSKKLRQYEKVVRPVAVYAY